jgi:hypothetical protein
MGIVQLMRENSTRDQTLFDMALEEAEEGGLGISHRYTVKSRISFQ